MSAAEKSLCWGNIGKAGTNTHTLQTAAYFGGWRVCVDSLCVYLCSASLEGCVYLCVVGLEGCVSCILCVNTLSIFNETLWRRNTQVQTEASQHSPLPLTHAAHTHTQKHTHSLTYTQTQTHKLHSLSLSLSLSLSHTHTHSFSYTCTQAHTHRQRERQGWTCWLLIM